MSAIAWLGSVAFFRNRNILVSCTSTTPYKSQSLPHSCLRLKSLATSIWGLHITTCALRNLKERPAAFLYTSFCVSEIRAMFLSNLEGDEKLSHHQQMRTTTYHVCYAQYPRRKLKERPTAFFHALGHWSDTSYISLKSQSSLPHSCLWRRKAQPSAFQGYTPRLFAVSMEKVEEAFLN